MKMGMIAENDIAGGIVGSIPGGMVAFSQDSNLSTGWLSFMFIKQGFGPVLF